MHAYILAVLRCTSSIACVRQHTHTHMHMHTCTCTACVRAADKYNQVARILGPIVQTLKAIPGMCEKRTPLSMFIESTFGGPTQLQKIICHDFFSRGFDGSGADNFYDAGALFLSLSLSLSSISSISLRLFFYLNSQQEPATSRLDCIWGHGFCRRTAGCIASSDKWHVHDAIAVVDAALHVAV